MELHEFEGKIGPYHWDAEPHWPPVPEPPEGAPNVLVVLLDDVGFAQLGCFGSDIDTPVFDRLADLGLRYTNFHTTALCSPTRACVLTGRNHHSIGMGRIIQLATGFPGYDARIPRSAGFLSEMLTSHGYAAYAVGKWHLTPEDETHLGASRERWPLGRGFERFYGFFEGETHQNAPALVHDNHQVRAPAAVEDGYHLTEDLVDHAVEYLVDLRHVDPNKPWFLYLAPGACHSPHQAPAEWIERYRGQFDRGWDDWREACLERQKAMGILPESTVLSERPDWVPAWETLSDRERAVYARYMEAFAGFLAHTDHHVGRLVDHLEATDELDDTIVMVLSDNGASSEGGPVGSLNDVRTWNGVPQSVDEAWERLDEIGGPRIHNNYPWGWTVAGNTPFRRWKREVHEGGVADPLILSWPAGLGDCRGSGVRRQYVHAIDLVPTILEAIGVDPPVELRGVEQKPIEGISFLPTITDEDAPDAHVTQYYEMFACRAIYHDGWKAVTYHPIQDDAPGIDRVPWELYDVRADPAEVDDLAATEPDRLQSLVDLWWAEADKHQVLPLDNRPFSELVIDRPERVPTRSRYVYRPHSASIPEPVAVNLKNRPHTVCAVVTVPEGGSVEGVIIGQGSILGGWALWVGPDGRPRYVHNLTSRREDRIEAPEPLGSGRHEIELRYGRMPSDPRLAQLLVGGAVVGETRIHSFTWNRFSICGHGLTCGWANAPAVCDDFVAPYPFSGGLEPVVVDVVGTPVVDPVAEATDAITSQ
ncbi:MAG: arylsulfatase [Acidimicrobiales bacterium]|nr:arylsulfatase [Acidimicrobiales bacterium]